MLKDAVLRTSIPKTGTFFRYYADPRRQIAKSRVDTWHDLDKRATSDTFIDHEMLTSESVIRGTSASRLVTYALLLILQVALHDCGTDLENVSSIHCRVTKVVATLLACECEAFFETCEVEAQLATL